MENQWAVRTRDLCKAYHGRSVVDHLNLHVPHGCVYGFLGPNGAGKSTSMKMMLGLARPTSGSVELLGRKLDEESRIELLRETGSLIESPSGYLHLTARENLAIVCDLKGVSHREIDRVLDIVRLTGDANRRVGQYSLGMKQRLAIALAVMHNPELLILDEPINGLDPIGIAEVRDFIRELCDATGKTILISSHILSEISLLADDIGIIDHGVLLEEESLEELEAKNGKYLRFTVSNAALAANLLQSKLGIQNIEVDSANELTVRDLQLDTGAAVRLFVDAGLSVSDAHLYEDTLEDYFKQVTGGEGIA